MNSNELWKAFISTGSPEIYLLYRRALNLERRASA